jgi:hypothetical protein
LNSKLLELFILKFGGLKNKIGNDVDVFIAKKRLTKRLIMFGHDLFLGGNWLYVCDTTNEKDWNETLLVGLIEKSTKPEPNK